MKKIILKTSAITVIALSFAALLVFSLWILISPQTMATTCERTGNYAFAVTCSDLKYKYSKSTEDLSRCCLDSILSGKDKLVVKYCGKLISDEKFDEFCSAKDSEIDAPSNYKSYICGNLSASRYKCGDLNGGLSAAELGGAESFIKLTLSIIESGTKDEAREVRDKIESIEYVGQTTDDLIKLLNEYIDE